MKLDKIKSFAKELGHVCLASLGYIVAFFLGIFGFYFIEKRSMEAAYPVASILKLIQQNYVDDIDIDSLGEKTIPLILSQLDPHSMYLSPEEAKRENESLEGSFSGIGIQFNRLKDTVIVTRVIPGGGSYRAGVLPGDRILKGDGKSLVGKVLEDDSIMKVLKGKEGTVVGLDILREGKPKKINVVRGPVPVSSVETSYMIGDKLYVKLLRWGAMTHQEFLDIYVRNQAQTKGVIIDLRDNGGGYLESVVALAGEFLPKGKLITYTEGKHYRREDYVADRQGLLENMPLVVLVNELSASASEIFAGAMQDHDRAMIIGRRTFGKGLVQRPFVLRDQSNVRLTVARYYTPSGRSIQKKYKMGLEGSEAYSQDLEERFRHGELDNADSVTVADTRKYFTDGGRIVHGGGGISPDLFIPRDTIGVNPYFIRLGRRGAFARYAFDYVDTHRKELAALKTFSAVETYLKNHEQEILIDFARYAQSKLGVDMRSTYLEQSRSRILDDLSFLIVDGTFDDSAMAYRLLHRRDNALNEALRLLQTNSWKPDVKNKMNKA